MAGLRTDGRTQRIEASDGERWYTFRPAKLMGADQSDWKNHSAEKEHQFKGLHIFVFEVHSEGLSLKQIAVLAGSARVRRGVRRGEKQDDQKKSKFHFPPHPGTFGGH